MVRSRERCSIGLYDEPQVQLSYIKAPGQPLGDAGDPYTGFDRFGRTEDMRWETTTGGALRDRFQWGYDRAGNRTFRQNVVAGSGQDEFYSYDGLYQLTDFARGTLNIDRSAIGAIPADEQSFTYDPAGNWMRFVDAEDGAVEPDQSRTHNLDNQLTQIDGSSSGLAYDKNGNATRLRPDKDGNWSHFYQLKWDAWNRLVELKDENDVVVATYAYDGATRRTVKTLGATIRHYFYNDQWRPLEERLGSSTQAERQYLWGMRHRDDLVFRDRETGS